LALVRLKDPLGAETAARWLTPSPPTPFPPGGEGSTEVHDLAIRCVHELDLREHLPALRKFARDPNEAVRIAALVALSDWGDEASRPAFEAAATSSVVRLQRAGKAALARLDRAQSNRSNQNR